MPGDGAAGLWNKASWNKVWPRRAGESEAAVNDPLFTEVVSDFSRRLSERAAEQTANDAAAAARQRRAALMAYDRSHRRRQILVAGFGVGALMGLALAMIAPPVATPPLAPTATASQPAPAMASAAVVPPAPDTGLTSPAPEPPPPVVRAETVEMPPPKAESVASAKPPEPVDSAAAAPLRADEILELQTKLRGFGFNPGPLDGVPGYMTTTAVSRYQQNRGLLQSGNIDRELLDQLRQDPAPQVAPQVAERAPRRPVRAGTATARREPDPFQRLGQWLDSLVR